MISFFEVRRGCAPSCAPGFPALGVQELLLVEPEKPAPNP